MKLAIDCGHGLYTAGKETYAPLGYGVVKEWELNNSVGIEIENLLKEYEGIEIKRLDDRTGKTDVSLRNRTNAANAWGADLLLSIHFNAGLYGKKGGGITVHGYPGSSKTTDAILRSLYNELISAGGLKGNRSNPISRDNFHMLRESNMRAILIENGFMDSPDDMPTNLQKDYHKKLAQGYVNFLVKEYGIKKKSGIVVEPIKATPSPSPASSSINDIKAVQSYLNSKIGAGLAVDGYWGPNTRRALIMYWQKVVGGLDVDGSFGPKSRAKAYLNNLDKGDRGELVKIMQMALICKKYSLNPYGADGSFGPATEKTVKQFQRDNSLGQDGICGTKTWASLLS